MLRGIVFYLFINALNTTTNSKSASMWAAFIVTSWFAIIHAVMVKGGELQFDPLTLVIVFIIGSALMGLRLVSGSLVFPVVGHSMYNLLIHLVAVLA
jgi:membrane protease YdiL (CAAX protease family)